MWNLNLLLRAHLRGGSVTELLLLVAVRLTVFNLIALFLYFVGKVLSPDPSILPYIQGAVALIFLTGFPLMRRFGFAPLDLSPQFFFPYLRLPPSLALGISIPYCAIPFILLLAFYSLVYHKPFEIFNLYAFFATIPSLMVPFLGEKFLRRVTALIPSVPVLTGIILLIAIYPMVDTSGITLFISSLLQREVSVPVLIFLMLLLGFLTSLGPSTLPLLPVVFGYIFTRPSSRQDVVFSILGFMSAFVITHSVSALLISAGTVIASDIFRVGVFNLVLSILLLAFALSLLGIFPLSLEISRLSPLKSVKGGSFLLGVSYTFSVCPSCSSILLGALALSLSVRDPLNSALLMGIFAIGRTIPVLLSGFVAGQIKRALSTATPIANMFAGAIFFLLSVYFFKNFLEAEL